ncbi:DUF6011 domain-containing protein [Streptomyces sp. NBC_01077]|uniref:DUF6011 domain-containing protein n=1 Tax=Streptomyces sp. NBC_01077 TaxID=2903746 RepID=UPI00386593E6|nr:DUF6011 domain-containing protein [Streptomyces sp. NBC_01077]
MKVACRVCGRRLRSRRYAAAGIGPVCARKTTTTVGPDATAPRPAVEHCPGQTTIPLAPAIPAAAVADIEAALDDADRLGETGHARAERAALYLASSGWTITPAGAPA